MRAAFVVAASVLAASAHAQRQITTADLEGNSVVIRTTTDADGDPATTTLRTVYTVPGGGAAEVTTIPTTTTLPGAGGAAGASVSTSWDFNGDPVLVTLTGTATRARTTATTTPEAEETTAPAVVPVPEAEKPAAQEPQDQGRQGPQGIQGPPTTTYPPMTATTYGYKNTAGEWVTTEWYQSYTAPTAPEFTPSAGVVMDLTQYKEAQAGVTAEAAVPGANPTSGAGRAAAPAGLAAVAAAVMYYAL